MVHKGGSQIAAFHTAGRDGLLDIRNETGRRFRPAGQLPAEYVKKPGRLRSIRIEEVLSVKVLWKSRAAVTLRHGSPMTSLCRRFCQSFYDCDVLRKFLR